MVHIYIRAHTIHAHTIHAHTFNIDCLLMTIEWSWTKYKTVLEAVMVIMS